mmetsp:Transcript_69211/g.193564  ORF Transcript_69211/g.193564 Transcript_69211/m.193564 type:complete len:313 (+) Transcript_69211:1061-1999(+)
MVRILEVMMVMAMMTAAAEALVTTTPAMTQTRPIVSIYLEIFQGLHGRRTIIGTTAVTGLKVVLTVVMGLVMTTTARAQPMRNAAYVAAAERQMMMVVEALVTTTPTMTQALTIRQRMSQRACRVGRAAQEAVANVRNVPEGATPAKPMSQSAVSALSAGLLMFLDPPRVSFARASAGPPVQDLSTATHAAVPTTLRAPNEEAARPSRGARLKTKSATIATRQRTLGMPAVTASKGRIATRSKRLSSLWLSPRAGTDIAPPVRKCSNAAPLSLVLDRRVPTEPMTMTPQRSVVQASRARCATDARRTTTEMT